MFWVLRAIRKTRTIRVREYIMLVPSKGARPTLFKIIRETFLY